MPTICRFRGITIQMFFEDHPHPHFHASYAEHDVKISIETLELIAGSLPKRQLRLVIGWAELRREELRENWKRVESRETLLPMEPLR